MCGTDIIVIIIIVIFISRNTDATLHYYWLAGKKITLRSGSVVSLSKERSV